MASTAADSLTLVSAEWLRTHLAAPDVRVLDATWRLPPTDRDARAEYEAAHIPGAVFFDIEDISDDRSHLPHTVPPLEKFVSRIRKLGVGDGHRIVVYDQDGLFSAARVWWLFRFFGHQEVAVLDGGLPAWTAAGGELEDMAPAARDRHFTPRVQSMLLSDVTRVSEALKLGDVQIVDARSAERFRGDEPEPRPGLRAGHMPGAINVPYKSLLEDDCRMKPIEELRSVFTAAGVDLGKPVVTSCGSGITAAIISLALERLGHRDHSLYDGSWAEWGASDMLPIETG